MIAKKLLKNRIKRAIFGCFFGILGLILPFFANSPAVYADEVKEEVTEQKEVLTCDDHLGSLGWLVCPTTGKISEAVDWLYDKNQELLDVNPVKATDDSPIYLIWKYFLGVTNVVFIIFLLVIVYSQITGVGISNYGVKKALPKLIIAAVMVNLSFLICSLAVDVSNVIGNGTRGVFTSIEAQTVPEMLSEEHYADAETGARMTDVYGSLAGTGSATGVAGIVAFEGGEIWMFIPTVLGALVAVVVGLITIALRQVVVTLLMMVAPLAIVAYILPNTENLFKKWKNLLVKMLVFYPAYSLLFGASSLAGWAIISSATNGFALILGIAVQIFPLFFSWSLMKMSGTFLGTINAKLTGFFATPLARNRAWADSHRELTRQKFLAAKNPYTPTLRLRQYLSDRKIAREEETKEYAEIVKNRGLAYSAGRNYEGDSDNLNKDGEVAYEMQARNMEYQRRILRHKNNMNKGYADRYKELYNSTDSAKRTVRMNNKLTRLEVLDDANIKASDGLKMEMARGAKIDFDNAEGYQKRMMDAEYARQDLEAIEAGKSNVHQFHDVLNNRQNIERLNAMKKTMEGNALETTYLTADAAHSFNAQAQIMKGKFGDLFANTVATQDVVNMLEGLTKNKDSNAYIDPIIAGLRTLAMRGDTDLVKNQINNILDDKKGLLGTRTIQSLANFLMFDVKNGDPTLRRFGKYLNMQTAKMYNESEDRRTRKDVSFYEYINGGYYDEDENGNPLYRDDGQRKWRDTSDKSSKALLKGTSFKDAERTAIKTLNELILENSVDIDEHGNKKFNFDKFVKNQKDNWDAIMPNIIGDQFSYLSGSEQITALGKGITGTDTKKHRFDWKSIFGEYTDEVTDEQKEEYIEVLNKRTKDFLGGQVPVQIAKTKTDILESVRNLYALTEEVKEDGGEKFLDPSFELAKEEKDEKAEYDQLAKEKENEKVKAKYDEIEQRHMSKIKEKFVDSYKQDALEGFAKMYHKGYQGEAKDGLIKLLDPEGLYKKFNLGNDNKQRKQQQQSHDDDEDDEDGAPVDFGDNDDAGGATYSQARVNIESAYRDYKKTSPNDVRGFWNHVKSEIEGSASMFGRDADIEEFERGLGAYTDVDQVFSDIIQKFFGGFNN